MKITKRNKRKGRILAVLLSCSLLFGLFPGTAALAEGSETDVGTDEGELVLDKWVKKTEEGFKLVLESYATGSDGTITTEPVPLDIVLVLDESGSMADVLVQGCGNTKGTDVQVTPQGHLLDSNNKIQGDALEQILFTGHKVFADNIDTSKTYMVVYPEADSADQAAREVQYCTECKKWFTISSHEDHDKLAEWIPFNDDAQKPEGGHNEGDWKYHVQFYEECGQTGRDLLQAALRNFLNTLYEASTGESPVDNRVAIVGYGMGASYINTNGNRRGVYPDPGDTANATPVDGAETLAENAWCNVTQLQEGSIDTWVNGVHAEGATPTHLGIKAAELAFDNAPETVDENRAKVMILFTDGTPGANYNNYGPGSVQYPDWVTPGIESAKKMKDDGVTIYSVGLFPSADGYHAEDISYNVNANGQGTTGFFTNANCFLHLVSSNYPGATGIDSNSWGALNKKYVEGSNSYYLGTSNASELSSIFGQISESITPGSTTVKLDETAIVKDKITDDFQITYTGEQPNVTPKVTAYTMSYTKDEAGKIGWKKDEDSVSTVADVNTEGKLHITVDGQTVTVTNFDFAENYVHMNGDEPAGKKLVVEILIKPTDETSGGVKLPTNATSSNRTDNAGIYGPETDTPVAEFPLPHVDLPTTVTVKKVVEGSDSTEEFSFKAEYVEAGNYENITADQSGGPDDSNYLQLKDGTIETVEFSLKNGETHTLQNVEAGSELTISEDADGWIPTVTTSTGAEALTPVNGEYKVTVTPGMVITFTNRPEAIPIDLQKYGTDYKTNQLTGARFVLYSAVFHADSGTLTKDKKIDEYEVKADETELSLKSGYYILEETLAPSGYQLLDDEILFQVQSQEVTLLRATKENEGTYSNVEPLQNNIGEMWRLTTGGDQEKTPTIQIKNNILYELPETGESGIYWYILGGVLLITAGALALYKNRRGEVLKR